MDGQDGNGWQLEIKGCYKPTCEYGTLLYLVDVGLSQEARATIQNLTDKYQTQQNTSYFKTCWSEVKITYAGCNNGGS